jgi:hypothetical protein
MEYFQMHFVAFVVIVNVFLVLHVCGDDSRKLKKEAKTLLVMNFFTDDRDKRSPKDKNYDKSYDKFLHRHFGVANEKYLDNTDEYKQAHDDDSDSDDHESDDGKGIDSSDDHDVEDGGDTKSDAEDYGVNHDWYYNGKSDYERIKALSEKQVEELHKKPGNCKHYEKDGMICATCEDPETGDNSESCAYSSEPKDKKVAYLSKKSHNYKKAQPTEIGEGPEESNDDESEDQEEVAVNPPPKGPKPLKSKSESEDADYGAYKLAGTDDDVEDYDQPKFGQFRVEEPTTTEKYVNDFEIIPQKQFESKNLNQAFADFKTKDWSSCNKIMKGDMTCYYCKDHKGAVQEECMFISASNPKNFKVERHESKNYDNTKKPTRPVKKSAYRLAPTSPRSAALKIEPQEMDTKERFARLRIGRPLMPTKASVKSTAEPLVTPKTSFVDPNEHDDFANSANKKTIKRTVSIKKKVFDNDRYEPAESRAISFRSFVRHFK